MLSVLVVDDHRVFADLLAHALGHFADVTEVRIATSVADARRELVDYSPDVAVLDVRLGDGSGLDLIAPATARTGARAIALTGHPRRAECERALALGASGYLAKDGDFATLTTAVRHATADQPMIAAISYPEEMLADGSLTQRERDVLLRIVDGQDAARIAGELSLSVFTVRSHIKSLLGKLGVRSQVEAVALASQSGLSAQIGR